MFQLIPREERKKEPMFHECSCCHTVGWDGKWVNVRGWYLWFCHLECEKDYKDDLERELPNAPAPEIGWPVLEEEETQCRFCGWYYEGDECQRCKDVRNAQDPELDGMNDDDEKEEEAIRKMLDKYFQEANKDETFG
ncbi:MAG TPA: hypothetical protein VJ327_03200 [Patescibacteria group bacterium]|nr:hypothetical protein [Patescibacteria group bacterium]